MILCLGFFQLFPIFGTSTWLQLAYFAGSNVGGTDNRFTLLWSTASFFKILSGDEVRPLDLNRPGEAV